MNKNTIRKIILVLSLIALFSIVLGGCTLIGVVTISTRGTVYITINEDYRKSIVPIGPHNYNIFMDGDFIETIESGETYELRNVLLGSHTFEAKDVSPNVYCYGSVTQQISSGTNHITIPVYTY